MSVFVRVGQFPLKAEAVYSFHYQCDLLSVSLLSLWSIPDHATFCSVSSFHCPASPLPSFGSVADAAEGGRVFACIYLWASNIIILVGRQVRWQGLDIFVDAPSLIDMHWLWKWSLLKRILQEIAAEEWVCWLNEFKAHQLLWILLAKSCQTPHLKK